MTNEIHNQNLAELIQGDEDYKKEFKSAEVLREPSDDNRRKIAREMVGFANRHGGKLIFGIDDESREVEGMTLDDEKSLKTISEVAHDRCEPKIEFTREFYSSEFGDVENGDVFVVDISQRRGPPHAVVEASGRDIKSREYRIRAGDRPRLVSTEELEWLFERDSPNAEFGCTSWFVYIESEDGLGLPKLHLPDSQSLLSEFYWDLSDEDERFLLEEEADRFSDFIREIAPFAFIRNLSEYHHESWDIEKPRKGKMEASPSMAWGHYIVDYNAISPNRDKPSQQVDTSDVEVLGLQDTVLNELTIDPVDSMFRGRFHTPPDVQVKIDLHTQAGKSEEYTRIPTLTLSRPNRFTFEIEFGRRSGWGRGPPDAHPIHNLRSIEDSFSNVSEDMGTVEFHIGFEGEFEFPDSPDPEVDTHQRYANQLIQILEENWDAYAFLDQLPDHTSYQINYKLDAIMQALGFDQSYF